MSLYCGSKTVIKGRSATFPEMSLTLETTFSRGSRKKRREEEKEKQRERKKVFLSRREEEEERDVAAFLLTRFDLLSESRATKEGMAGDERNGTLEEPLVPTRDSALAPSSSSSSSSSSSPLTRVCPFILGNELCERLAYYGLCTNLVVYFREVLELSTPEANTQVNIWAGTCYVTPILGAIVADSYLGRYKTIMLFSTIYLVGLLLLVATNVLCDKTSVNYGQVEWMLFIALYTIALGTGGIKPNVSSFGADQFDENDPVHRKDKESFFNWFYMFINIGSLIASTVVVYVQQEISWTIGFIIPAACMFLATCIFFSGRKRFVRIKPAESPIMRVLKVMFSAKTRKGSSYADEPAGMRPNMSYAWLEDACEDDTTPFSPLSPASASASPATKRKQYTHEQVEEVRLVVRLFPMFLATCFYWTIYSQMQTLFVSQGMTMNTSFKLGGWEMDVPPASLSSFDTISIIVLIPLYDQILAPILKRGKRQWTVLKRIGVGLCLASVSMIVAGVVEMHRLRLAAEGKFTQQGVVDMSVFWQVFQYVLVGASEVFAAIGQLELFYDQAPDSMRSCSSALALLSTAIGGYVAGGLIPLVNQITEHWTKKGKWIPSDLNKGHLDYFFFSIAALNALNLVYFLRVASKFQYKKVQHGSYQNLQSGQGKDDALLSQTTVVNIPQRRNRSNSLERTPIRSLMPMPMSPALPAPLR